MLDTKVWKLPARLLFAFLCVIGSMLIVGDADGQEVLTVRNDMQDAVHFFLRQERDGQWKRYTLGRGRTTQIRLYPPDEYDVASIDLQGVQYNAGLLPLKKMIRSDPRMVLRLSGIFRTKTSYYRVWDGRRWEYYLVEDSERAAIIYDFDFTNQEDQRITSRRPGW